MKTFTSVLCLLVLTGCATTMTKYVDADGTQVVTKAWNTIYSEQYDSAGDVDASVDANGNWSIKSGQSVAGQVGGDPMAAFGQMVGQLTGIVDTLANMVSRQQEQAEAPSSSDRFIDLLVERERNRTPSRADSP